MHLTSNKIKILNIGEFINSKHKDVQDFIYKNGHNSYIDVSRYINIKRFGISFVKYSS
jgi:hypothetical protein